MTASTQIKFLMAELTVPIGAGYNLTLNNTTGSDASPAVSPAVNDSFKGAEEVFSCKLQTL